MNCNGFLVICVFLNKTTRSYHITLCLSVICTEIVILHYYFQNQNFFGYFPAF